MFVDYNGNNLSLVTAVSDLNRLHPLITGPNVRDVVKRKVINNYEARLISVIRQAAGGDLYDKQWLVANRREMHEAQEMLNDLRINIHCSRTGADNQELPEALANLEEHFSNIDTLIKGNKSVSLSAKIGAVVAGSKALGVGVTVTGGSAFSFFGGPLVGLAVTTSVGGASLIASGAAAVYGAKKGATEGKEQIENGIRMQFGRP